MTTPVEVQTPAPPSLSTLAKSTAFALAAAAAVLVTFVLPAEYGVDPIGAGRLLGLTRMAAPAVTAVEIPRSGDVTVVAPVQKGPIGEYPAQYKFDAVEIALGPYEYVEYKYQLENGASMLYAWTATAPLIHDFHGEAAAKGSEQSYDKENRRGANGSFTAPFAGIHGWYWENPGSDTVVVTLKSAGFYTAAIEIRSDRTRRPHALRSPESWAVADETTPASRDR
jgi:hypothetical protein